MIRISIPRACFIFLFISASWACGQSPALPVIPAGTYNVTSYGAVGDDMTTNTTAIQDAIEAASAAGGGTVEIPAGTYLSGPLTFASSINLQLDAGAILQMLPYGSYPGASPLITFPSLHDVEISGTGTLNGGATSSGWWGHDLSTSDRPVLLAFSSCDRVLIEDVTLENPPSMHITVKGSDGNITVNGITINTSGSSPNTDGIDLIGTNCLVENSSISDGDDCIALGSTGGTSSGTLVTNCTFGTGHGMSIGSNTSGGVSNLVVINCTFNGTQYGIRLKSDDASSSGGEGGLTQNLLYENLTMTSIQEAAIVIYSYYNENGTPVGVTPATVESEPIPTPIPSTTCAWRNIVFSNITATVSSGTAGILWGRTELPITNVILNDVNITAPKTFDVYNTRGFQFINSKVTVTGSGQTFTYCNAGVVVTNSSTGAANVTLSGLADTNAGASVAPLALYNQPASTTVTDLFAMSPITLSGSTLTVNNNFQPPKADVFDFAAGTNVSTIAVNGNLTFSNATINVTNGPGFGAGTYTLFTYTGSESGAYTLGTVPTNNFNYALTNTAGQIQFLATSTGPSLTPVTVTYTNNGGQLKLSWPLDHKGWFLEIQTNKIGAGLGTNWTVLPATAGTNIYTLPINQVNNNVFLRLMYTSP